MIRYILDTDHITLIQRSYPNVVSRFQSIDPQQIFVTSITIEEQLRGRFAVISRYSNQPSQWIQAYAALIKTLADLREFNILNLDNLAVQNFQDLRQQGIRIGSQDLKIASIALAQQCIVVTRNNRDFGQIPGLALEDWSI